MVEGGDSGCRDLKEKKQQKWQTHGRRRGAGACLLLWLIVSTVRGHTQRINMPLIYKHHTLVAGAAKSQRTDNYIPVVYISWEIASARGSHSLISRQRFPTFEEASEFAYTEAKTWVDQHAAELD